MKKYFLLVGTAIVLVTGCSSKKVELESISEESTEVQQSIPFTYSFLNDDEIQHEVSALLLENGVSQSAINSFFTSVNHFNKLAVDTLDTKVGFETINLFDLSIDYAYIQEQWDNQTDYLDQNCRLTVFNLMKEQIKIDTEDVISDEMNNLIFDEEIIKENPNIQFTDEEASAYHNFYTAISTKETTDQSFHVKQIQKEWKNRGIKFDMDDNISIISVFLNYNEDKSLFIGHTGVLIKTDDGYLFLEKVASMEPYIVSKYSNIDEFKAYLTALYGNHVFDGGSKPIFMQNDKWLNAE